MSTTTTANTPTNEELITKMYEDALASQTAQLQQAKDQGLADLQAEQEKAQQRTTENLNQTYVEAARDQANYAEVQNAYGLSSGAMAQARLAQANQLEADSTALRTAQANIDANIERERTALSQQYEQAIAAAQADNDLKLAEALYQEAKDAEARLQQKQREAAETMAAAGDFSALGVYLGLTPDQVTKLEQEWAKTGEEKARNDALTAAQAMAAAGDFSRYAELYGLTPEEVAILEEQWGESAAADEYAKALEAAKIMAAAGDYTRLAELYGLTPEEAAILAGESTGTGTGGAGGTGGTGGTGGWLNEDGTVNTNMIDTTSQWWKDYAAANGLDPVTGQHIDDGPETKNPPRAPGLTAAYNAANDQEGATAAEKRQTYSALLIAYGIEPGSSEYDYWMDIWDSGSH